jgi:uncharacterized membrane protein
MQPPQGNYVQYPRGGGPGGGGYIPTRGPGVYFDLFSKAFEVVRADFATFVLGCFVCGIVAYMANLPASFVSNILIFGNFLGTWNGDPSKINIMGIIPALLIMIPFYSFSVLIYFGIQFAACEFADTGQTSFNTLFSPFKKFKDLFVVALIETVAAGIASLLCGFPALLVVGLLISAPMIVMYENRTAMDAVRESIERSKPFMWSLAGFVLVGGLVASLGVLLCCVGLFVTLPMYYIALSLQYRELRPMSTQSTQGFY